MGVKKKLLSLTIFLLIPFIIIFDSLVYFLTRPACLNCGNLIEFLKNASLTVFLLGGVGYKLRSKNNMPDRVQKKQVQVLKLRGKTAVFIDYANVKAWAKKHGYLLDLRALYIFLKKIGISKISLYYGADPKNPSSFSFLNKLRTFGFEVITKDVKYIKVSLLDIFKKHINQQLLNRLSSSTRKLLLKEVGELEKREIKLLLPKANFDVEITLDMILFIEEFNTFILFSGDGDFAATVKYLRSLKKRVIVVADKKFLSGELYRRADGVIFFADLVKMIRGLIKNPGRTGEEL